MARVSKTNLKNAVRECLIEILEEGLSGQASLNESKTSSIRSSTSGTRNRSHAQPHTLPYDKIMRESHSQESRESFRNEKLDRIAESAKNMTDDPVLCGIFADTARTTLQEQVRAESGKPANPSAGGDAAAAKSYQTEPSELFGSESAEKWAQLAFADPVKK
jgi:hypothetical protein